MYIFVCMCIYFSQKVSRSCFTWYAFGYSSDSLLHPAVDMRSTSAPDRFYGIHSIHMCLCTLHSWSRLYWWGCRAGQSKWPSEKHAVMLYSKPSFKYISGSQAGISLPQVHWAIWRYFGVVITGGMGTGSGIVSNRGIELCWTFYNAQVNSCSLSLSPSPLSLFDSLW